MAKTNLNRALSDIRGRLNGWVYRRTPTGEVSISPIPPKLVRTLSAGQVAQKQAFGDAAAFARSVLANPLTRPLYEAIARDTKKPIFSIAVGDYFKPPRVNSISFLEYHGRVGEMIKVRASDDVQVVSVFVSLHQPDGTLIESGSSTLIGEDWVYLAKTAIAVGASIKARAVAKDLPEHEFTLEKDHMVTLA